nr:MAG TPA: hypothetical protein [Caudoviricetes sp.]
MAHFHKKFVFLKCRYSEIFTKNMIQKRLSWKQQTDNLCMSAMLLF